MAIIIAYSRRGILLSGGLVCEFDGLSSTYRAGNVIKLKIFFATKPKRLKEAQKKKEKKRKKEHISLIALFAP